MRLIIYTGKGGTGKTVSACSTAIKLAENKYRTLLISSDPAHTLTDAFAMPDLGYEPKEILTNLQALQIDPLMEMNKQYTTILSYMATLFHARGIDETLAYELAMLPGMTQLFSLLKIEEVSRTKRFDTVVLDMAASGEALRYLYFPKLVGSIGRKLTGLVGMFSGFARIFQPLSRLPTPPQNVLENELELLAKLDNLNMIMMNQDITSIRLVTNPDTFSIENAKRAFMSASLYGINVDLAIINKIMPTGSSESILCRVGRFSKSKDRGGKSKLLPTPCKGG